MHTEIILYYPSPLATRYTFASKERDEESGLSVTSLRSVSDFFKMGGFADEKLQAIIDFCIFAGYNN